MSAPVKFRKKPVVVEAVIFPEGGASQGKVADWIRDNGGVVYLYDGAVEHLDELASDGCNWQWKYMSIESLEGRMHAAIGDYIIKGTRGEFYPCKPGPFADTYEEVPSA